MQLHLSGPIEGLNSASPISLTPKEAYRNIRNFLAGQLVGATRDETLLEEVLKCLFTLLYSRRSNALADFADSPAKVSSFYLDAFQELRNLLPNTFGAGAEIRLDPTSLTYVHRQLAAIKLTGWAVDPFGDAYEAFIGSAVRGQEGQFFTPQNAINLLVSMISPRPGERIIDPACGAGGFLSATARYLITHGARPDEAAAVIFGVDKDRYLANLAANHVSFVTLSPANVSCADSLAWTSETPADFPLQNQMGTFDIVLTNPPFGVRIVSVSSDVQRSFDLGYRWRTGADKKQFYRTTELLPTVPPQVLFIERCLALVRAGGRIGMVVPESLISGKGYRHVVEYIRGRAKIQAVLGMPETLFKSSGKGGTHTKTCLLVIKKDGEIPAKREVQPGIFMAEAQWCGHDSRGRDIEPDDLPEIDNRFRQFNLGKLTLVDHLGYVVPEDRLVDNILAPRYYNPDIATQLNLLQDTHDLVRLGDLVSTGLLQISSGDEIGKLAYGTGTVPYVRTSDISNWEIKVDPKHGVSDEIYHRYAKKQDVREGDILMVRDGTYLIGTCAFVTKHDETILYQSHLYKIRVTDHAKLSPYLLIALLSSAPVKRQIKAKRFTQDIIDSLGDRIHELVLPIPKIKSVHERVTEMVRRAIEQRVEARELTRLACQELVDGLIIDGNDD